jgi:GntR family transcriptional regulator, frlABCD operon transcriptional regulator
MDYLKLNPFDTEPLYRQLKNSIRKAILSQHLKHQEELPSENALVGLLDISSTVVKSAYKLLEKEGLIQRIRGKGTFVNYPQSITINLPFVNSSFNRNIDFNVNTVSALTLPSSSPIWAYFPKAKTITKLRRLIKMNQVLTTYQEVFLPNQSRDTLHDLVLGLKQVKEVILSTAMDSQKGKWVNQHGMKKATHIESTFLNIPMGTPMHKILSTVYESNKLIGLVFTFIRGDVVSFRYDQKL